MRRIVFSLVLLWSVAAGARTLAGAATGLNYPWSIYVNLTNNEIGVVNNGNNSITVYSRTATGNAAPCSPSGMLFGPFGEHIKPPNRSRNTAIAKWFDVAHMPNISGVN